MASEREGMGIKSQLEYKLGEAWFRTDVSSMSDLELQAWAQIRDADLPEPEQEYQFLDTRKFRWDFCWPSKMVALEIQGGIWTGGAHVRPKRYEQDCHKLCLGVAAGWKVLWATPGMLDDESMLEYLREVLA